MMMSYLQPPNSVEMYFSVQQMTPDTTSKHIKDYHHKNDRIKHVSTGFEPFSGDVARWRAGGHGGVGGWRAFTLVIDSNTLYLLGALLAHTPPPAQDLGKAPSRCRPAWYTHTKHTHTDTHSGTDTPLRGEE